MKIEIHLNTGMKFTAHVEGYKGTEFAKVLNNPQITHVSIGDLVLSKHALLMIVPVNDDDSPVEATE